MKSFSAPSGRIGPGRFSLLRPLMVAVRTAITPAFFSLAFTVLWGVPRPSLAESGVPEDARKVLAFLSKCDKPDETASRLQDAHLDREFQKVLDNPNYVMSPKNPEVQALRLEAGRCYVDVAEFQLGLLGKDASDDCTREIRGYKDGPLANLKRTLDEYASDTENKLWSKLMAAEARSFEAMSDVVFACDKNHDAYLEYLKKHDL